MVPCREVNASYSPIHQHQRERLGAADLEWTFEPNLVRTGTHLSSSPFLKSVLLGQRPRRESVALRLHHRISLQHRYHGQPRSSDVAIHWSYEAFLSISCQVQSPCRCCHEVDPDDRDLPEFFRPLHGIIEYQALESPQKLMLNWNIAIPIVSKPPTT